MQMAIFYFSFIILFFIFMPHLDEVSFFAENNNEMYFHRVIS